MNRSIARQQLIESLGASIRQASVMIDNVVSPYLEMGDGRPVVFLHGISPGGAMVWHPVANLFAQQIRPIMPDMPGFGEASTPQHIEDRSYYATWLDAFLDAVGLDRVSLIAASFGGAVALEYCQQHPANIHKLVLVNASGLGSPTQSPGFLLRAILNGLFPSQRTLAWLAAYLMGNYQEVAASQGAVWKAFEAYVVAVGKANRAHMRRINRPQHVAPLTTMALQQIAIPIMLVWGEKDPLFPLSHAQHGSDIFPQAHLETLPDAGHLPYIESPSAFTQVVMEFLDSA